MRTLLVDNHDSYTYNVFHLLAAASGEEPVVVNNDAVSWRVLSRSDFDAIVLSPGPGRPERWHDFGVCRDILRYSEIPVLGICLGHQGIGNLLRRRRQPGADGDARPPQPRPPRRHRPLRGDAAGLLGRPLPLAGDHQPDGPAGPRDRLVRRRRGDGGRTRRAADVGRPVPPRVDRHRARPRDRRELLRAGRARLRAQAAAAGARRRPTGRSRARRADAATRRARAGGRRCGCGCATIAGRGADRAALRTALRRRRERLLARQRRRADLARPVLLHGHQRRAASGRCSNTTSSAERDAGAARRPRPGRARLDLRPARPRAGASTRSSRRRSWPAA